MKSRILALVILSALATVVSADSWLCIADKATGFAPIEGKWEQTSVRLEGDKFVVRELTEEEIKNLEMAPEIADILRRELLSSSDYKALDKLDKFPTYTHLVSGHGEEIPSFFCVFRPLTKRFICDGLISQSKFVFKQETGRFALSRIGNSYLKERDDVEYADLYTAIGRCSKI